MPNPYAADQIPEPSQDVNPYSLEAIEASKKSQVRQSLYGAVDTNPDQYAEARRLSRSSGIPAEVVARNPETVKRKVALNEYDALLADSPKLANRIAGDKDFARVAHDDVGTLKEIESSFREAQAAGRAVRGKIGETFIRPGDQRTSGGWVGETFIRRGNMQGEERSALGGVTEPVRRGFESTQRAFMLADIFPGLQRRPAGLSPLDPEAKAVMLADQQRRIERFPIPDNIQAGMQAISGAQTMGEAASQAARNPRAVLEVTMQSLGASAPVVAAAIAGSKAGPLGTAAGAGLASFAVEFASTMQEFLNERGVDGKDAYAVASALDNPELLAEAREKAVKRGIPIAIFDALTAGVAGRLLAGAKGTAGSVAARSVGELAVQAGGGAAGEATAQAATGEYKPGDILLEALAEMPSAFVEVPANIRHAQGKAQQAEQTAVAAEKLVALADASKLRQRDPEAFKQFLTDAAEDGDTPSEFYINAEQLTNSLNQSAVTIEQLRAFAPAVAQQLESARFVPGADIRVPVAEFAAADPKMAATLIEHLREAPDAMSRAEAQAFMKEQGARIEQEVGTALAGEAAQTARAAAVDAVRQEFEAQLNATGKFRPEVNTAYATMLGNFYATQAERSGMTVDEFMDRYQLRVTKKDGGGQQRLEQAEPDGPQQWMAGFVGAVKRLLGVEQGNTLNQSAREVVRTPEFRQWFGASAAVDDAGKPKLVYHGTRGDFAVFDRGQGGKATGAGNAKLGFFFTDRADVASRYARIGSDQQGAQSVMPVYLSMQNPVRLRAKNMMEADKLLETEFRPQHDSAIIEVGEGETRQTVHMVRNPTQIKSAFNGGQFDPSDPNILSQGPRGSLSFGNDITSVPSIIAMMEGADLSTFLHESGHLFLEVQADLAARIQRKGIGGMNETSASEEQIVQDMNAILEWMGIPPAETGSRLDTWLLMSLEEKREHHESWARGFERFLMEGKAPSQELQGLFSKFRSWLISVYKALSGLNVELTDEVRQVMGRMMASDEAIAQAQDARNMGPLFESPETAGMTPEAYRDYQALGERQTTEAAAQVDARLLKDMKWLSRARDKALKARQAEVDDLRKEVEREVRAELLSTPVYRAWAFLTGKQNKVQGEKTGKVGEEHENLFAAIGRAGGLNRDEVKTKWGFGHKDADFTSGVFGKPVLRKGGGLSIDAMAERMIEAGYLVADENGKADLSKFEALFNDQSGGIDRYSIRKDYEAAQGDRPAEALGLEPAASGRLNTDELRRMYGEGQDAKWRLLSERRMTSPTGLDPEAVAAEFGFTSGDHMVNDLVRSQPPHLVIEELTDQQMLERFGDITSQEALDRAADEAVHNEVRARVVATELKALEKATTVRGGPRNTVDVMARAAREYAYAAIAAIRYRDLRPSQYGAAAARSAKLAQQALGKSTEEAAMHKRNELINGYAAKAAYDAQEEVRALQKYMRKFDKRIDSIDPGYQDQIEQLLERFEFRPASLKAIDKRKSFAAWYAEQEAAGNAPSVPDELLQDAAKQSYKDMTVEELRGLRDTVKQIEHQGRLKKKLLLARDKRDFDAIATDMAASIIENGGDARPVELEGPNPVMDWFAGAWASHRKLASLFRQMDGNKDAGPMWEYIGRSMNEQSTSEDVALEQATVKLRELYAPLLKMRGGVTGHRSKVFIREINASLTRGGRLSVALNWGNEANRQRIMDGDKWTVGQVQAILKTLSPVELDFVNKVWEFIDSYWSEIAAKEKRLTGVEPEKVEAAPFNVLLPDGTEVAMRGGYYPLKYDTDRSDRADQQEAAQAAKEMMQGVFSKATTRRGHTKERLKEVKRAVRKDLNVITQHVTQVVHDLAWHEWLIDTNKLLGDDRIVSAIRGHYGPPVLKTMRDDVLGIATADVVPMDNVDKLMLMARSNVTRATMGASVTTAFLQPFGLTQSITRIGGRHVLRGLARWGGDAARMESAVGWIHERSEFMRLRAKTFNRELREIRGSVAGKSATMRVVDAGLFVMMQKMQTVADVPTWLGQYEKSKSEGLAEADAIAMADRAVLESQGGGATKDMAEVQRKHPMLTQFYSYFSVTLNLAAEQTAATDFKNPAAVAGWLGDMAMLMVIPAILPSFILYSLRGGDDDDEKGMLRRVVEWQVSYLLGTVVLARELSGAVAGFDYAGPPVGRIIGDIGKAGTQTAQGEIDEPAVLAYARLMGDAFGIPMVQILRSYKGWKAWDEGREGAGPQSILLGPPPRD